MTDMKEANKLYGLIGYPLGHSFSKDYFISKFRKEGISRADFMNFPIHDINELNRIIESYDNLLGLSVTIPHKESVIGLLDNIDAEAGKIGAVNAVKVRRDGDEVRLSGYNTDSYGFKRSLEENADISKISNALVLGSGGASKAVLYALENIGISCSVVSRNKRGAGFIPYEELTGERISESRLIVNTTPLGMFPKTDASPEIPYELLGSGHILFDLSYNPEETLFLAKGKERGAKIINGLQMLHFQAERAWEIWNEE